MRFAVAMADETGGARMSAAGLSRISSLANNSCRSVDNPKAAQQDCRRQQQADDENLTDGFQLRHLNSQYSSTPDFENSTTA
ncbi:MAG TPA: hypothetical protein VMV72_07090 [Verrucomicrobiae bacterium]|nr:hypothetical protein [Verrucomicrobiae bacterium]